MKNLPTKSDFLASIGVFVIALPLSLGIALASGASIQSAIIASVVGGVIVGALSGAPLAVTGPAAGLTVIVFEIIRTQGLKGLVIATVSCGTLQVLMGVLKLGGAFKRMPHSILDGMLAAIGSMIALGQFYVAIGRPIPNGFIQSLSNLPSALSEVFQIQSGTNTPSVGFLIAALTIAVQLTWEKKFRRFSYIPGAVVALSVVTALCLKFNVTRVSLNLSLSTFASGFSLPTIKLDNSSLQAVLSGCLLAAIGSIESLATASGLSLYAKKMKGIDLPVDLNKELRAQGFGNILSGFFGGIPVTSVIVRSAANIQFGATSRWSTILHGVWILIAVLILSPVLNLIPLSGLAAVLIVTGFKLVNLKVLKDHFNHKYSSGIAYLVTFAGILSTNLLKGIVFGSIAAIGFALKERFKSEDFSKTSMVVD